MPNVTSWSVFQNPSHNYSLQVFLKHKPKHCNILATYKHECICFAIDYKTVVIYMATTVCVTNMYDSSAQHYNSYYTRYCIVIVRHHYRFHNKLIRSKLGNILK